MTARTGASTAEWSVNFMKLFSALLYGVVSFLIMIVNKIVLTSYAFPSAMFLGIGQMITTLIVLLVLKNFRYVDFPEPSLSVVSKVFPLPIFYVGNLVSGFIGTKRLSLPMFTVLRRFSIVMTLIGEYYVLNVVAPLQITMSVTAMVGGAIIAAVDDLGFDLEGYTSVLLNDLFTAANGVYSRKKLDAKELGKYGLLFYNTLIMITPLTIISIVSGDFERALSFAGWQKPLFILYFLSSCVMGFGLMYSTLLCTAYNSALTTTIVGCLKNIMTTYLGMYIGGDYIFSWSNFFGLNLSMVGSLIYSYLTFVKANRGRDDVNDRQRSKDKELLIEPIELKVDAKNGQNFLR